MQKLQERSNSRNVIEFAGHELYLDAAGILYWPAREILVVSDLHFEKSSFLARAGNLIPPYDTADTIRRLHEKVKQYQPRTLIFLGDSFHDAEGWHRMGQEVKEQLCNLTESAHECIWVEGNHDSVFIKNSGWRFHDNLTIDGITFAHEEESGREGCQIIGHYHPKARFSLRGHFVRGSCFIHSDGLLIMPAFGSYTGGLDITDPAIKKLFGGKKTSVHMLYRDGIYRVR